MTILALDLGTNYLSVFVPGHPAPQGSKRLGFMGRGGSGRPMIIDDCKKTKPWRSDIRSALLDAEGQPQRYFDGAVNVHLVFVMPRPVSTPKRRTPQATKKPDLDKLARAVFDAVGSAGVWRDDSQVVGAIITKRIAELSETAGCRITIGPAPEHRAVAA